MNQIPMSHMILESFPPINLSLNQGPLVRMVPVWIRCSMACNVLKTNFSIFFTYFSILKIFSRPAFLLIAARCHDPLMSAKSDIPVMEFKISPPPPPGILWDVASYGSRWVHSNDVTITPPNSSPFHAKTTIQTAKEDAPIIVPPSGNGSDFLVGVDYGWLGRCIFQN